MKNYSQILNGITNTSWAILPHKMDEIMCLVENKVAGIDLDASAYEAQTRKMRRQSKTVVLPLSGVISQKQNLMTQYSGGTSTEVFGSWFDDAMADGSVSSIVLDVDSPGGSVYGISELSCRSAPQRAHCSRFKKRSYCFDRKAVQERSYFQQSLPPPPLLPLSNAWFSVSEPHFVSRVAWLLSGAAVTV